MTRWRTCNNRRRRKEEIASWWWLGGHGAPRTPLTLDKMRAAIKVLSDPELTRLRDEGLDRWWREAWAGLQEELSAALMSDQRIAITRDGKRIDPNDFYAEPAE